jgi:hypothetical protein
VGALADQLLSSIAVLESTTQFLIDSQDIELAGSAAVDYLNMVGYVCYAYMWVKQLSAIGSNSDSTFIGSKIKTAQYFFAKLLPITSYYEARIRTGAEHASSFQHADF